MNCPKCSQRNPKTLRRCAHCGAAIAPEGYSQGRLIDQVNKDATPNTLGGITGTLSVLFLLLIVGGGLLFYFGGFYDQWRQASGYQKLYHAEICFQQVSPAKRGELQSKGYEYSHTRGRQDLEGRQSHQNSLARSHRERQCWRKQLGFEEPHPSQLEEGASLTHSWVHRE